MSGRDLVTSYKGLEVVWIPELDGGGQVCGQEFLPMVQHLFGKVGHVYEVCAGCGFVGFSLLAHGLCDRLTLSDINPRAVEVMRRTIKRNNLADRVDVYLSDGLSDLPRDLRFDLVVSNPPWYENGNDSLIAFDPDWRFHRSFFAGIGEQLNTAASILFQENSGGAEPEVFLPMLAAGGLSYIQAFRHAVDANPANYFLWAKPLPRHIVPRAMAPAEPVAFELTPDRTVYELEFPRWYQGTVVNKLGRPLDLSLEGEHDGICVPLWPDSTATLPSFILPPGRHEFRDRDADETVMTILVRDEPTAT
jgi:Methyltransferase small domain